MPLGNTPGGLARSDARRPSYRLIFTQALIARAAATRRPAQGGRPVVFLDSPRFLIRERAHSPHCFTSSLAGPSIPRSGPLETKDCRHARAQPQSRTKNSNRNRYHDHGAESFGPRSADRHRSAQRSASASRRVEREDRRRKQRGAGDVGPGADVSGGATVEGFIELAASRELHRRAGADAQGASHRAADRPGPARGNKTREEEASVDDGHAHRATRGEVPPTRREAPLSRSPRCRVLLADVNSPGRHPLRVGPASAAVIMPRAWDGG